MEDNQTPTRSLRAEQAILPITALLVLAADQFTKHLVATRLPLGQSIDLVAWLAPIIHITHVTNTGAIFGLFQGKGDFFPGQLV